MAEVTSVQLGTSADTTNNANTAAARYKQLEITRDPFLRKARAVSELTVPSLFPPPGVQPDQLRQPFQSIGARGVNNLASKLLLALLPPNQPFFKEEIDELALSKLRESALNGNQDWDNLYAQLTAALSLMEQSVVREAEGIGIRHHLFEALRHAIVAGNFCLGVPVEADENFRVYHLDRYVVQRDPSGTILELIIKESVAVDTLPPAIQKQIKETEGGKAPTEVKQGDAAPCVDVYTHIKRAGKLYTTYQEIGGRQMAGTAGSYPIAKLPFICVRFIKVDGESYGNSYAGEYEGDLLSLENLSQSLVEGSAAAARLLFLVNPNGSTRIKDLAEAPNGAFKHGNKEDVTTLSLDKFNDFTICRSTIQDIEARLNAAFLLNSSVQRQAERVTAEEIRFMARELEDALGGVYSLLAAELQLPLVGLLKHRMAKQKRLPTLPTEIVKPRIVTGFDALGRNHDLEKLDLFIGGAVQTFGPSVLAYFDVSDFLTRRAAALAINAQGLVKTKEQLQQEQQQQMAMTMAEKLGPNAVNKVGDLALQQQQQQPAQ